MSEFFSSSVIDASGFGADIERRSRAATSAFGFPAPSAESEVWRYSPINDLDLDAYRPVLAAPSGVEVPASDDVEDRAGTVTIVDGWVTSIEVDPTWEGRGLGITATGGSRSEGSFGEDADRFDALHEAFAPPALTISVKAGLAIDAPIVLRSHHRAEGRAAFPHIVVDAGEDSEVSIIEYQTSDEGEGLSVPVVELHASDAARLRYVTVQELGSSLWQLGRQISNVGRQASLLSGIAAFGGAYARVRTDTRLVGQGASGDLVSVYYADGEQIHDFRTFQHHDAPDTLSDLLFKGTIDDQAGSIYTGMIHIHPDGRGSNANQTNRNVKLSEDAWAWSTPNLEIENNEVRCSHASTVSPIDKDQQFYLHTRGVRPAVADRLIVAGFFAEVLDRFPGQQFVTRSSASLPRSSNVVTPNSARTRVLVRHDRAHLGRSAGRSCQSCCDEGRCGRSQCCPGSFRRTGLRPR